MIRLRLAVVAALLTASLPAPPARAQSPSPSVAMLRAGEFSPATITAPFELVAVDPEATAALRAKEMARQPVMARLRPESAIEAASDVRVQFAITRDRFNLALEREFGKKELTDAEVQSPAFARFRETLQKDLGAFPLTPALAKMWAQGWNADATMKQWTARVEAVLQKKHIRPAVLPPEAWSGAPQVRLLPAAFDIEKANADALEREGELVALSDLLPVTRVREDFIAAATPEQRPANEYLAQFLKPDCEFEAALTRRIRDERTASLRVTLRFGRGQTIVKAGELITPRTKVILEQLAAQMPLVAPVPPRPPDHRAPLITAAFASTAAGLFVLLLWRWRRTSHPDNVEVVVMPEAEPPLPVLSGIAASEVERVRAGMMTLLRDKFVGALLEQRRGMIDAQMQAQAEMAELEERLVRIQAPLQERLSFYEQRIVELEKEIARRDEQNRELLQETIRLMQMKVLEERAVAAPVVTPVAPPTVAPAATPVELKPAAQAVRPTPPPDPDTGFMSRKEKTLAE